MAQRALTLGNAAYCSECGADTLPDAAACGRCGETFESSMQAVLCPICNSINEAAARECVNCNAKFPEPGSLAAPRALPDAAVEEGKGYRAADGKSKMPSYNDLVTLQEVIDLVAYLKGLKGATAAPTHGGTAAPSGGHGGSSAHGLPGGQMPKFIPD